MVPYSAAMATSRAGAKGQAATGEIVRREELTGSSALTAAERKLLAEALRRGEEARDAMEDSLASYGRWVLANLFDDDAATALTTTRSNAVWSELMSRAGGPTLRLSARMLSVCLNVAAYDRRITDEAWRGLDLGRKELLLPLGDDRRLRDAAKQVTTMKLTLRATRDYVTGVMARDGGERAVRLTAPRLTSRVRRFREGVGAAGFKRKVQSLARTMDDAERAEVTQELEALRDATSELLRALKKG